jgi:biopolymer transport protein ExbD
MKRTQPRIQEHLNPNLIPMIDIMFLLLLFFMLGADMGQRELEDVRLPKADRAKKEEKNPARDRLTINAHHRTDVTCSDYGRRNVCRDESHWKLGIKGKDCTDPKILASMLEKDSASWRRPEEGGRTLSERRVMLRADGAAPYALAQRALNACAGQGIYQVEVGAALPQAR